MQITAFAFSSLKLFMIHCINKAVWTTELQVLIYICDSMVAIDTISTDLPYIILCTHWETNFFLHLKYSDFVGYFPYPVFTYHELRPAALKFAIVPPWQPSINSRCYWQLLYSSLGFDDTMVSIMLDVSFETKFSHCEWWSPSSLSVVHSYLSTSCSMDSTGQQQAMFLLHESGHFLWVVSRRINTQRNTRSDNCDDRKSSTWCRRK